MPLLREPLGMLMFIRTMAILLLIAAPLAHAADPASAQQLSEWNRKARGGMEELRGIRAVGFTVTVPQSGAARDARVIVDRNGWISVRFLQHGQVVESIVHGRDACRRQSAGGEVQKCRYYDPWILPTEAHVWNEVMIGQSGYGEPFCSLQGTETMKRIQYYRMYCDQPGFVAHVMMYVNPQTWLIDFIDVSDPKNTRAWVLRAAVTDYQRVGGVLIPLRTTWTDKRDNRVVGDFRARDVEFNPGLSPTQFDAPSFEVEPIASTSATKLPAMELTALVARNDRAMGAAALLADRNVAVESDVNETEEYAYRVEQVTSRSGAWVQSTLYYDDEPRHTRVLDGSTCWSHELRELNAEDCDAETATQFRVESLLGTRGVRLRDLQKGCQSLDVVETLAERSAYRLRCVVDDRAMVYVEISPASWLVERASVVNRKVQGIFPAGLLTEYFFMAYKSFEGLQIPMRITLQRNFYWKVTSYQTRSVKLMPTKVVIPTKPSRLSLADILQSSVRFVAGSTKGRQLSALRLDDELLDPAGNVIAQRSRIVASDGRLRLTEKRAGRVETTVLDNGRCRYRKSDDAPATDCTREVEFHAIQAADSFPALGFRKECHSNASVSRSWSGSKRSHSFYIHCGVSPSEGWSYEIEPSGRLQHGGYSAKGPDSPYARSKFDDWRSVTGIHIPFRADIESRHPEIEGVEMRLISAQVDPKVDDRTFKLD